MWAEFGRNVRFCYTYVESARSASLRRSLILVLMTIVTLHRGVVARGAAVVVGRRRWWRMVLLASFQAARFLLKEQATRPLVVHESSTTCCSQDSCCSSEGRLGRLLATTSLDAAKALVLQHRDHGTLSGNNNTEGVRVQQALVRQQQLQRVQAAYPVLCVRDHVTAAEAT